MVVVVLLLLTLAFAKENFRVSPNTASAAEACFNAGLCDANGCCSGHGYCDSTTTPNPTCICDVPTGCHSSFTTPYSGTRCETGIIGDPLGSPDGCCLSDTYEVKREINGACNPRSGNDPNMGLRGNLLRRSIFQNFTNPYASNSVQDVADYLTGNVTSTTNFTMLGLAILEAGQLDIVRYALSDSEFHNISGVLIPKLKHQVRTGEAWGTSTTVKKQFENRATGLIDLDFLYELAVRVAETTYGTTGPYIDYAPVLSHYEHLVTEHLLVFIEFLGHNHNFLVRSLEAASWAVDDGDVTPFDHTTCSDAITNICSTYTTNQQIYDKLFEWARSANIRFLQIAIGNAGLSLLAPHDQPTFEYYFHAPTRDWSCELNTGDFRSGSVDSAPDLSGGSIFTDQITRNIPFTHLAASGINYLYSMAEPINFASVVTPDPTCNVSVSALAQKMFLLAQTKTRAFGSQIDPAFYDGLTLQLLRERELEVESYNAWMAQTGSSVARVDTDLYLGLHKDVKTGDAEYSTSRLFQDSGLPRVLLALYTPINDALMLDEFGVWTQRSNGLTKNYLTELETELAYSSTDCSPIGFIWCTGEGEIQQNAWALVSTYFAASALTIQDDLFRIRSPMHTHVCTYPGLLGSIVTAGNIHHAIMSSLLVDFSNGWTSSSYQSINQPLYDWGGGVGRSAPNSLTACIPWRVGQTLEGLDSTCCQGVSIGQCDCAVNAGGVALCGDETGACAAYDNWIISDLFNKWNNFTSGVYHEPASPDGFHWDG